MMRNPLLSLPGIAFLLLAAAAPADEPSPETAAFLKSVEETRETTLRSWTKQMGFRSLKADAKAAGADFAMRVYLISSWNSFRVTVYRNAGANGSPPPASPWKAVVDYLGILGWADNKPMLGGTANPDKETVTQLEKLASNQEIASLPQNRGEVFVVDGASYFCEFVRGEDYLWRYRSDESLLEGPLKAAVAEAYTLIYGRPKR
jgi:hypothetical protein